MRKSKSESRSFERHNITEASTKSRKGVFWAEKHKTFDEISKSFEKTNNVIKCKEFWYKKDIIQKNISLLISWILSIKDLVIKNKNHELYNKMCLEFLESINYENLDYINMQAEDLEEIFLNLKKEFAWKQFFLFTIKVKENIHKIVFEDYRYYKY